MWVFDVERPPKLQNIVANDAEASKRAVQMAAESETGGYFDAVCGTGFFSYIGNFQKCKVKR